MHHDKIKHYLRIAYQYTTEYSHDDSTHVGAIIIIPDGLNIYGANRFTSPTQRCSENLERSRKYPRIAHAEREVIYTAARLGTKLKNCIMVCPWATCPECAQAIVLSGIRSVYAHKEALDKTPERWLEALQIGQEILADGGVEFIQWAGKVGDCENLFNKGVWCP